MKKVVSILASLFIFIAAFAQDKGEMYLGIALSGSFGNEATESFDGSYTTNSASPLTTSYNAQAEFGYFIADRIRLALAVGVPYSSSPVSQSGNTWLYSKSQGFAINPNVAYYIRIADGLYYTPEIGFSVEFGDFSEDLTPSTSWKAGYGGWSVYANIIALEFRVTDRFAIGAGAGSAHLSSVKISDNSSDAYYTNQQLQVSINSASIQARLYF